MKYLNSTLFALLAGHPVLLWISALISVKSLPEALTATSEKYSF
jgi:hypothetical protein